MSGHPIGATDIAGYNCFVNRSADRELFMRWTELGALLPVMRNHRGQDEVCDHWQFNEDRATLEHYKKYAVLHTRLFPYIYTLAHRAAEKGWPVVRHLMLHYPEDPRSQKTEYQYLLGDRLLAAPVLERDAREWEVYLPPGKWTHWWSGKRYSGPGTHRVPAGLGEVPLFVHNGKVLPLFNSPVDTLVEEDREDINGFSDANGKIRVVFYGNGSDSFRLWDGTVINCIKEEGESGNCEVKSDPASRQWEFDFR
jgi:alpha-glucosidase (family GH31 glycosyl hydrolase)